MTGPALAASAETVPEPIGVIACTLLVLALGKGIWILIRRGR